MGLLQHLPTEGQAIKIGRLAMRALQFIFGITIIGLYGVRLTQERHGTNTVAYQWTYAVVVGVFASITSLVYTIPYVKAHLFFIWDFIMFLLELALFATFCRIYHDPSANGDTKNTDIGTMQNAVWVDFVSALLWLITAVYGALTYWKLRQVSPPAPNEKSGLQYPEQV